MKSGLLYQKPDESEHVNVWFGVVVCGSHILGCDMELDVDSSIDMTDTGRKGLGSNDVIDLAYM